jgi:predicted transglutaminase-like cysteine proteinase
MLAKPHSDRFVTILQRASFVGLFLLLSTLETGAQSPDSADSRGPLPLTPSDTSKYVAVSATPYDNQMARIRSILNVSVTPGENQLPVWLVDIYVSELRVIPFGSEKVWPTPEEFNLKKTGDGKAKSVALYETMTKKGATVLLVVGKRAPNSTSKHVWLLWRAEEGVYILDPTFNMTAVRRSEVTGGYYIPYYAYSGGSKLRNTSATFFSAATVTPYDRQMTRIRPILTAAPASPQVTPSPAPIAVPDTSLDLGATAALPEGTPDPTADIPDPAAPQATPPASSDPRLETKLDGDVSLSLLNSWMAELRAIPYNFKMEWRTPEEVMASSDGADCKSKGTALYHRMRQHGAANLQLVIGKRTPKSKRTHAWLFWETIVGTYLLDPTFNSEAVLANTYADDYYVAVYAYSGNQKLKAAFSAERTALHK